MNHLEQTPQDDDPETEEQYKVAHKITLKIEPEPYAEMIAYAHKFSPDECSGVGMVERIDYDDRSIEFKVTEVFLPNQYNTGGTTDIPEDELNKVNTDCVNDDKDTTKLKFHWHSHVDMSVFHSGTDDENYDELQVGEYAVSLVVNKRGDMLGSVHLYEPLRIDICNIEVEVPVDAVADEDKVKSNYDRVKTHEPALRQEHGVSVWTGQGNYDAWDDYIMDGLAMDYDFEALLVAGEKEGIITLFYDYSYCIIGYMNNRTNECYTIGSEKTHSTKHAHRLTSEEVKKAGYLYD